MRSSWRLSIFLSLYLPIVFVSQRLGQMFSVHIDPYGLYFTAAVCGLRRTEAVIAALFFGFWLDALQSDGLFGLSALLLSALSFACYKRSWRVVLEAHAGIFSVCAQCFLQISYLLCAFTVTHTFVRYLQFYAWSFAASAAFTAILTPLLLRFQRKCFAE